METIYFSTAHHEEIESKLNIYKCLKSVFYNLDIKQFVNSLNEITIIFQAINPQSPRKVETFKKMRRKTKTLELYLVLDYERVMEGSDEENLAHIKDVFVQGCETFLKPMKGFDWDGFDAEVQKRLDTSV